MVRVCAFPGCFNREKALRLRPQGSAQDESLTFHTLPMQDPERLKLWLLALHRDINSPVESIRALRVCSGHFSPDDFPGPNRRYLKSTAVPVQLVVPTEARHAGAELQMEGRYDVNMDSDFQNDFSFVTGSPGAALKLEGGMSASSQSTEAFSPLSCTSAAGFPPDSEDSSEAGTKSDLQESVIEGHRVKLQKTMKQEDVDLRLHDKRMEVTSEPRNDKQTDEEDDEDREMNTEDTAQCSEELVITKVEDFTSEMPIDVDYTGDHSGRMEVDKPEYADTQTAKDDKNRMESFGMQTEPVVRLRKLHLVQPSVDLSVKIKEEPIDEECRKSPQAPERTLREHEDFTQTPDEITIRPAFPVGGNAIGAPAARAAKAPSVPAVSIPEQAPFSAIVTVCAGCKRIILKGKTAFQRSGSPKLYCSPQCLCITSAIEVKKKTCHHCLKEISHPKDVLLASVDTSGTTKEFCSQKCISAFNFRCSVCQRTSVTHGHEVKSMGTVHKLCSDVCFNQFLSSNKLTMNCCMNCGGYCKSTDGSCPSLQIEGNTVKFCTQKCLKVYKKRSLKTATCKMCHAKRPSAEMVVSQNSEGGEELFCSDSCATTYTAQTLSSSGTAVECKNCKKKQVPQYHLTMSEGTVQNFCSFTCVVSYEAVINKKQAPKKITSTSNNVPAPKPAAPRSAPAATSSSVKTASSSRPVQMVTRLPCAQCLQSFSHKPKLLEFKKKMYVFCDDSCVGDFGKTKNVTALCEYCKTDQVVKSVKRISKVDRTFCGQKCKLLFEDNLANEWGEKYCRDCFYCDAGSKTRVTGVFNDKQEEFCETQCLSKYTSLIHQDSKGIKCTMCKQGSKMNETVKWLDEMKHFCNLRCLMFFCSLQAVTGAVTKAANKSLSKRGATSVSSTVHQRPKETTPIIANVRSFSSEANGQSDVLESKDMDGSVPSITVEVPEDESFPEQTVSTQKCTVRTCARPRRNQKRKALPHNTKHKTIACKPNTRNAETQSDEIPKVIVLPVPVPVPVFVPVPMNLYTQYVPQTVGLPLPIPVPMFLPTTLDSAERIVKTIQEIKEKIPDDPLEADLIMMAEMVAEDAEREKKIKASDQKSNLMDIDSEDVSSNLSWEEDSVSSAQTLDQTPELEKAQSKSVPELEKAQSKSVPELEKALSKSVPELERELCKSVPELEKAQSKSAPSINPSTLTPTPIPTEEPQIDLQADFPVASTELIKEQKHNKKEVKVSDVKQKPRRKDSDSVLQKKRDNKCAASATSDGPADLSKMQHESGVSAWKNWVRWRNSQPHVETPKFGARSMTLKEDLLKCSTAELSYGLSKFISEVCRPNGENYSLDSIFYLCLGIQQHLFKNNRMENIFTDVCYSRFCQDMTNMLKGWTPTILSNGYVHSQVEEKYMWDCKQLGAFSPGVLLNTLLYFFTKFFNYKTVEQHRRLYFGRFKRYCQGQGNSKVVYLHFYPHKEDTSTDGVPAKKRKKEDERGKPLKIKENTENPFRCPVRLFEFYLSKCSPSVRHSTSQFYLNPERSCVPSSPTWFSTSSLSDEALENMLARILTVRELYMQEDQSPHEAESDSDSD
ncbi:zinc finger MYM-type protein 4 isoform X2 [Triplophysa rosa]|uniref:THAP-type domain-containing protein n=1 Tax=Triplophysa rosa TaxID=992332 RepID=A0A9W7WF42_TRIRA|nr:zinc finger MYM-type protein 4 isoform X2 [Triplophysa rosa]KAI7799067.1 hypothetical protein IRJ41_017329 [Triplophysa rosa]